MSFLAKLAAQTAEYVGTDEQRKGIDYARGVFGVLGDLVGLTFVQLALAYSGDRGPIDALAEDIRAAVHRVQEAVAKATHRAPPPPPQPIDPDVLISNPESLGCGSPFCRDCGTRTGRAS